jgi:type I restriction enzyme, S subunit
LLPDDVYLPDSFTVSHEKYLCEEFDYHLIMVGASVGNRGLILPHHLPALRNQNMWCFRPIKDSGISKAFVKYMLDTLIVEKMGLASGSAREFFRKGDFQNHKIVIGNKSIQTVFSQMAFPLLQKQATNGSQAERLANIRDTLLPKLLSGQLRIPDAEQQLAEAL